MLHEEIRIYNNSNTLLFQGSSETILDDNDYIEFVIAKNIQKVKEDILKALDEKVGFESDNYYIVKEKRC